MQNKIIFLVIFLLIIPSLSDAQTVFDTIIGEPNKDDVITDFLTIDNSKILLNGYKDEYPENNSFFLIYDTNIGIQNYINFPKYENNTLCIQKNIKTNSGFLFIGSTGKTVQNKLCLYSYDNNYNFLWQKEYELYKKDTVINFFLDYTVNTNNEIVIIGSAGLNPFNDGKPFAFTTNFNGDSLFLKKEYNAVNGLPFIYDIDTIPNTDKYLVAAYEFRLGTSAFETNVVRLNNNLEIDSVFRPLPINGSLYEGFWGNSQLEFLTDTTFIMAARKNIVNKRQEEEVCVQLYDTAFNLYKETCWGAEAQSMDYFSNWGLNFIDNSAIYVGATSPIDLTPWTINHMMLTKLDENLDIVWTKFYGGNASYRLDHVIATEDGGCIMVGKYLYPDTMNYEDIIILKVDADGNSSLSAGVENAESFVKDVIVYPNPTTGLINIQKGQQIQNATIEIFDLNGKLITRQVLLSDLSQINLENNPKGTYIYKIMNKTGLVDTGKIILE